MQICKKCGHEYDDNSNFCENCGAKLFVKDFPNDNDNKANRKRKNIIVIIAVSVIFAIVLTTLSIIALPFLYKKISLINNNSENIIVYIKENELYCINLNSMKSRKLSHNLLDLANNNENNNTYANYISAITLFTFLSNDGKKLYYPDRISSYYSISLYLTDPSSENAESYKIDSDIYEYHINNTGNICVYLKNVSNSKNLYLYKNNEKTKIASDVKNFIISDDGNKIIYVNNDNDLYLVEKNQSKTKLISEVGTTYVMDDFHTFYYQKDDNIYVQHDTEERIKIASNAIINYVNNNDIYYYIKDNVKFNLSDFVYDDLYERDIEILNSEEPKRSDYQLEYQYSNALEYWKNSIQEAKERNNLRNQLKSEYFTADTKTLYCYNGKKSKKIISNYCYTRAYDSMINIVSIIDFDNIEKVKFSDIVNNSISYAKSNLEYIFKNGNYYTKDVIIKDDELLLDIAFNASEIQISPNSQKIYLSDIAADELYYIDITDEKNYTPKLYDTGNINYLEYKGNHITYYKYINNDFAENEFYIDKKLIDSNLYPFKTTEVSNKKSFLYLSDYNENREYGTLYSYDYKDATKISDYVSSFHYTKDDKVIFIYDKNTRTNEGELKTWDGKTTKLIDTDVNEFIITRCRDNTKASARGYNVGFIKSLSSYDYNLY